MSQIFKKKIPVSILDDLLNVYCNNNDKYYLINDQICVYNLIILFHPFRKILIKCHK